MATDANVSAPRISSAPATTDEGDYRLEAHGCGEHGHGNEHEHEHEQESLIVSHPHQSNQGALGSGRLRPPTPSFTFTMASDEGSDSARAPVLTSPFNFQTQYMSSSPPVQSNIGHRRSHRYKHSSISTQHQVFQEPPPRPPPVLPASLPVPTLTEAWASMQRDQRARLWWCVCHSAVVVYVFFSAGGSLAMMALSHLVFFDVGSAAVCVVVDVLGNFEVWRRSSIRHPFGLQRAEVLAGFAMSVFLVFGGFDLLSHSLKHVLESDTSRDEDAGAGPSHAHAHTHAHSHANMARHVPLGTVDTVSLAALASTLVSAYGLRNHGRAVRRLLRMPSPALRFLPESAQNPFHVLTLTFAFVLLLMPLVSVPHKVWLDRLICACIAVSMFGLGARLAVAQGLMLLMSYGGGAGAGAGAGAGSGSGASEGAVVGKEKFDNRGSGVATVVRAIEAEPHVARVDEAQFWQVHYGLAMANLKLCLRGGGCDDRALTQLRTRIARLVQNGLGEGYGRGGNLRWEVTVQTSTDGH